MKEMPGSIKDQAKFEIIHKHRALTDSVQSLYDPKFIPLVGKWIKAGCTRYEVAKRLEISVATLLRWASEHPELGRVIKISEDVATDRVEMSLYEKAVGWQYTEKVVTKSIVDGEEVEKVEEVEKQMPPDNGAMMFFLKNKRSHQWKDKHEVTVNHNLNLMTSSDLEKLISEHVNIIDADFEEVIPQLADEKAGNNQSANSQGEKDPRTNSDTD